MNPKKIWFDGKLIPWDEANVHVTTHALHYGSSILEGLRAYATPKGPAILALPEHAKRLLQSAQIFKIELPYSLEDIERSIIETVRVNEHRAAYIRPLAFKGAGELGPYTSKNPIHLIIFTKELDKVLGKEAVTQGIDVMVSSWRRMAQSTYPAMGKIGGNYVNSQFMTMEAKARGFTEAIALDTNGYISESSGANIFLVKDGVVYTPSLANSILAGITRRIVMQLIKDKGYQLREESLPREMLYIADEIFFTGTAIEIMPVRSVDDFKIGSVSRGPVTETLQQTFFSIVQGQAEDRYGWLTYVDDEQ